jgi:hypothetical protein
MKTSWTRQVNHRTSLQLLSPAQLKQWNESMETVSKIQAQICSNNVTGAVQAVKRTSCMNSVETISQLQAQFCSTTATAKK